MTYRSSIIALFCVGIVSLIASTIYALSAPSEELKKLQAQVLGNTVQLNENCSGTLIWSKRDDKSGEVRTVILTAGHCVQDDMAKDVKVDFPIYQNSRLVAKNRYIGRTLGVYFAADLALVQLVDKQTYFATVSRIAPDTPEVTMGEDAWTVGYPLGAALTVTKGLFGALETIDFPKSGTEYFRATPDIAPGNSGGALYHKNGAGDYELLGVTTAGMRGFSFVNFYTPIEKIRAYLKVALPEAVAPIVAPVPATGPGN